MLTRAVPRTGERLPVIGMGTWETFDVGSSAGERDPLKEVLRAFAGAGGAVIDSSPMYGAAEAVTGDLVAETGAPKPAFMATKVWTRGRAEGEAQIAESQRLLRAPIDLLQVHNLLDFKVHIRTLRRLKEEGKIRYIGATHYVVSAFADLERVIREEGLDFVQIPYSLAVRAAEDRLLPAARDRGVAVLVNRPFDAGALFDKVRGVAVPPWAADLECTSWAQLFLKSSWRTRPCTVRCRPRESRSTWRTTYGRGSGRSWGRSTDACSSTLPGDRSLQLRRRGLSGARRRCTRRGMVRSKIKEDAVLFALLLAACGDSGGGSAEDSTITSATNTSTGCVGAACTTVPTSGDSLEPDPTSAGTGDGSSGDGPASTSGDDTTTGPPLACPFTPGCHKPGPPPAGMGRVSEVPLGCDGGPYTAAVSIGVGASGLADPEAPRSIPMLADFDADGDLDLFLNMRKAGAAFVFPGNGDGTFNMQAPAQLAGGLFSGGWGGDVADFNGDGTLDVLVGDHVRGAYAWTGGAGLSFAPAITGLPPMSELFSGGGLFDFDGDGALDAIFGEDQFGSGYAMVKGDGAGGWVSATAPMTTGATNIGHFQFADYDDDGQLDVFGFGKGGQATGVVTYVYHNDGGGSFSEVAVLQSGASYPFNADPVQGSIGDINCDGLVDVAGGGTVHLNMGGAWQQAAAADGSHIGHLADMNGDGHLDLVTQDPSVGLAVYTNDGTGTMWTPAANGLPDATYMFGGVVMDSVYGLDVGDVNGNDTLDIVRVAGFGAEYAVEVWVR